MPGVMGGRRGNPDRRELRGPGELPDQRELRGPGELRDQREVIRDEPLMRRHILKALAAGPLTIPEIAAALGRPTRETVFWVMGMRKYGHLTEIKEANDDGFYLYQATPREER